MRINGILFIVTILGLSGCASDRVYQLNPSQSNYVQGFQLSRITSNPASSQFPIIKAGASLDITVNVVDADEKTKKDTSKDLTLDLVTLKPEYAYDSGRLNFCNNEGDADKKFRNQIVDGKKFMIYLDLSQKTEVPECYTGIIPETQSVLVKNSGQNIHISVPSVIETDVFTNDKLNHERVRGIAVKISPKKIEYYFSVENGIATVKAITDDGAIADIRSLTLKRTRDEVRTQEINEQKERDAADENEIQENKKYYLQMQKRKCPSIIKYVTENGGHVILTGSLGAGLAGVQDGYASFVRSGQYYSMPVDSNEMAATYIELSCGDWWAARQD